MGTGGSDGAARLPPARILPARRVRLAEPANDNRAPFGRRLRRLAVALVVIILIAATLLV